MSGIRINGGKTVKNPTGPDTLELYGSGNLTGLVIRDSDGQKVLVTAIHLIGGFDDGGPSLSTYDTSPLPASVASCCKNIRSMAGATASRPQPNKGVDRRMRSWLKLLFPLVLIALAAASRKTGPGGFEIDDSRALRKFGGGH